MLGSGPIATIRLPVHPLYRERVEIVGGDFFKEVPKGGDLYVLKAILHDWDDAHCVSILKNVRAAMKPTSKVVVVEVALADHAPTPAHLMDLNMLVMSGGAGAYRSRVRPPV